MKIIGSSIYFSEQRDRVKREPWEAYETLRQLN